MVQEVRQAYQLSEKRAAWELGEIRPGRNYSEDSFFWRESKRWRYAGPSSLYDTAAPLSRISHSCARLLPSLLAI